MLLVEQVMGGLNIPLLASTFLGTVILVHVVPWAIDPHGIRHIPGPFLARFSDIWLGWVSAYGHRSEVVHEMHKKYGPIIRLAPNHVSIARPAALQIVYGHGNGALKSDFYDAFVSIRPGLFNTRNRAEHARKRKIISHLFSMKSVVEFEPNVREYVGIFLKRWDALCDAASQGKSGRDGHGWEGREGRLWLDCLPWFNYLAFDIIGDLAFGAPFGMLLAGKDAALVPTSQQAAFNTFQLHSKYTSSETQAYGTLSVPAIKILNDRGEFSMSIGVLPPWWRPIVKTVIPWYRNGAGSVKNLAGIAVNAVAARLATDREAGGLGNDRVDLLGKLKAAKDGDGNPMGREELTAECQTQLIAGSDTTSNSSCAITYFLAANPSVQQKLQAELDQFLGSAHAVSSYDEVKHLKYLDAVINEGLRLHSTSSLGLPRVVPSGGMEVEGHFYPEGTVLSVPTYTIHRDVGVWGDDVENFRPERWFERDANKMAKIFNPFSYGPRSCVGRNLASMELAIIISSVLRRFSFVLEDPKEPLHTREGFLRKPLECRVGIRKRDV